jgi:hypothetical protein
LTARKPAATKATTSAFALLANKLVSSSFHWSGRGDLNARPPAPQDSFQHSAKRFISTHFVSMRCPPLLTLLKFVELLAFRILNFIYTPDASLSGINYFSGSWR